MHDFLLAREIVLKLVKIGKEKNLSKIFEVVLKIGSISLSHDNFSEHADDINLENLTFGAKNLAKGTILENAEWKIEKVAGNSWSVESIMGE